MLAPHLLQSALVLVNTRLVDRVLNEDDWSALMTEHDRRGLTPAVLVQRPRSTAPSNST